MLILKSVQLNIKMNKLSVYFTARSYSFKNLKFSYATIRNFTIEYLLMFLKSSLCTNWQGVAWILLYMKNFHENLQLLIDGRSIYKK